MLARGGPLIEPFGCDLGIRSSIASPKPTEKFLVRRQMRVETSLAAGWR
jgi:hypothetical protein